MNMLIIFIVVVFIVLLYYKKDNFYNIKNEAEAEYDDFYRPSVFTNQVKPAEKNQEITKTELAKLFREIMVYANGAPQGANVSVSQNKYDLIFKDVLVCSDKRNMEVYPNPNNYYVNLNIKLDKVYKAELIDVYIPAATDEAVNIPPNGNRLYFTYKQEKHVDCSGNKPSKRVDGYVVIQAGTYISPENIAIELTRQFALILTAGGIKVDNSSGVSVIYDKNLNRYNFRNKQKCKPTTFIIYAQNDYVLSPNNKVMFSMAQSLMLYEDVYISGPKYIDSINGVLVVRNALPGDYGKLNGYNLPLNSNCMFSNCILSDVVLTHCKLYLSLGKLNGNTCNITPDENGTNKNVPNVFCQVPNNTCVSSASVKTLLNQPHNFSAIQFYNPPISKVNKFEIKWYTDNGKLVRILDHCFTVRIYYFQKRIDTTEFSYPVP
jgi:hypothetical protein